MNEKKKAVPVRAHQNGQEETNAGRDQISYQDHYIMDENANQGFIASLLQHGRENAIPGPQLADLAGLRSTRQLQREVERERIAGALILSNDSGYYLPDLDGAKGRREIMQHIKTLRSRSLSILRTLKAARAAVQIVPNQEAITNE